jgi:DNA phosphorothioation-associated putative methyltransferase
MLATGGKRVADKLYIHVSLIPDVDETTRALVSQVMQAAALNSVCDFNVIRIQDGYDEVALLNYSSFFSEGFPTLGCSWRVHVPTGAARFRDYSQSLNPPILHRKELLLSPGHPDHAKFAALTSAAVSLGLFDDPLRIGFKAQWQDLVRRRGYRVVGHEFVPIGNVESTHTDVDTAELIEVQRHLTALTRTSLSAPIQSLLRHELLTAETSFFDYGCGKGDDLRGLSELGIRGSGWDPYHRPTESRVEADVVNLGFVVNVIEDFDERVEALLGAYELCRRVLAVSAMLEGSRAGGRAFRDGILTGRHTFQKYYTQAQLQQFIEAVLDEEAIPAAPGVFYVFLDRAQEHRFLLRRQNGRTRSSRATLPIRAPREIPAPRKRKAPIPVNPELELRASQLWARCLVLGRTPEAGDVTDLQDVIGTFGSLAKGIRYCIQHRDPDALERSAQARREEILVTLALARFSKRRRFQELEGRLQRDIKALFGSMAVADSAAQELLFSVADSTKLNAACEQAASWGLGKLEPKQSLQLHTSLIERLPAILRVYVGCATALFGDVTDIDLVKLHLQSGKVSLMRLDDFVNEPLPAMTERIKVKLKDQELDIFQYGDAFPPPLLYDKSRFINEEFPYYAEQTAFEESLHRLSLIDLFGYGPPAHVFHETLSRSRWEVKGFSLERSQTFPHLDASCSRFFTYRQLIEAGKTCKRTGIANLPSAADSFNALADLARLVLDPVVEYYGAIEITYGFCSGALAKHIQKGIAPKLDQHAAHEMNSRGGRVCERGGAAVDFRIQDEDMLEVAEWIATNLPFDRLYYYGRARPLHVSYGPEEKREVIEIEEKGGRRIPRRRRISAIRPVSRESDSQDPTV